MVYDPSAKPVSQLILEHIEDALRSIEPPDFGKDLASNTACVRQFNGNAVEFPGATVGVAIVPGIERHDSSMTELQQTEAPISLCIGLLGRRNDWKSDMQRLLADARVAVLADERRGGVAVTTEITGSVIFDAIPNAEVHSAQIDLCVYYRTPYGDPTTAR